MYTIIKKKRLINNIVSMDICAPRIAAKARPGQFVIVIVKEGGERIPFTVAECDQNEGTVKIIFQEIGASTKLLGCLNEGDLVYALAGPLGKPSHLDGYKKVCVIGGGLGTAIAYPQAKYLHDNGTEVHAIIGYRNSDLIILEDEIRLVSSEVFVATEDGSRGTKGFVTDVLKDLIEAGNVYDMVIAIGPLAMMRAVCNMTKEHGIKTIVSMNPIMVDGTGMCGGCRITVGGETKFACVDGPEFDGHLVDFDEAIKRQMIYKGYEAKHNDKVEHICKLGKEENDA